MFKKKRNIFSRFAYSGVLLLGIFLTAPLFADPVLTPEFEAELMEIRRNQALEVLMEDEFLEEIREEKRVTLEKIPATKEVLLEVQEAEQEARAHNEQVALELDLYEEMLTPPTRKIFKIKPARLLAHSPLDSPAILAGGGTGGSAVASGTVAFFTRTITQKLKRAPQTTGENPTDLNEILRIQNYHAIRNGYISGKTDFYTQNRSHPPLIAHNRAFQPEISTNFSKKLINILLPDVLTGKTGPLV